MTASTETRRSWLAGLAALAAVFALQWPLWGNPGYFSHDELQWGARSTVDSWTALPWLDWLDYHAFQYRPLTFNLWLLISHALFEHPAAFHLLWWLLGAVNAGLLHACLRRLGAAPPQALGGALAFLLSPFAVYVHGWVATLGDLLWLGAALALLLALLKRTPADWRSAAVIAAAMTTIGLLSKEAALVIAPLLLLGYGVSGRQAHWCAALLSSCAVTAVYLTLRLPILLFAPRPEGAYAWSMLAPAERWLEMQLYPFLTTGIEFATVARASSGRWLLAALIALGVARAASSRDRRAGLLFLVGGTIAIGPPLLLTAGYPHYGYGYAAWTCAALALAWPRQGRIGRTVLLVALLLSSWHGITVQRELRRIGELQTGFSPTLAAVVADHPGPWPLRLAAKRDADRFVYIRLSRNIPHYAGQTLDERILLVAPDQPHHRLIEADGRLLPARSD